MNPEWTPFKNLLESNYSFADKLQRICGLLTSQFEHYNWAGIYFMNHQEKGLFLGPFAGEPTEHTSIPFGKGICGQVAVSGKAFIVQDVKAQDNYIACSLDVKSEVVYPIYFESVLVAQLDIDSHFLSPFNEVDDDFLNWLCHEIGKIYPLEWKENLGLVKKAFSI